MDVASKQPEPLLSFGKRALVHFAVSTDEVRMTTKLAGAATRFLPFNRGNPDGIGGAGQATRLMTSWATPPATCGTRCSSADAWLAVVGKFLSVEVSESKDAKGKKVFNHFALVPALPPVGCGEQTAGCHLGRGRGQTYLVQHSAGSGKSNTIGWLAHRLASLHDANDEKVYSSVIVITDR